MKATLCKVIEFVLDNGWLCLFYFVLFMACSNVLWRVYKVRKGLYKKVKRVIGVIWKPTAVSVKIKKDKVEKPKVMEKAKKGKKAAVSGKVGKKSGG
uniref:M-ORF n=1 Tax=Cumberlandia monodonta TaxID=52365 RepID=A0A1B2TRY4_CUMMO|nr:MORF [Cumberlandia monodonta]AQT38577.1 M-ORF [Cumberlandia monodonta]